MGSKPRFGRQEIAARYGPKSKERGEYDERAADIQPLVQGLLAGYRRHGLYPRAAALELNWRLATTETARQSFFVHQLRAFGVGKITAQYGVLRDIYFSKDKFLSQSQIMRVRGVSSANVTRLIHGLERFGLVRRDVNPNDRRSTVVYLTEAGLEFCEKLVPAMGRGISNLGDCFTDDEIARFNELLARLHVHIEEMAANLESGSMSQVK